ncbi:MAG TPA: hypothetical protein VKS21_09410 [Spirochaetota bacterium]|nr:hypothetical protein [Spirochaetota bacterium]
MLIDSYKLRVKYTTGQMETMPLVHFQDYNDFRNFLKRKDIIHIEIYE